MLHFSLQDRDLLSTWLAQGGWPRGTMDVAMLEGYLVGLLVWPVRVQPGAWLPPIWAQTGWKVPAKIGSQGDYESVHRAGRGDSWRTSIEDCVPGLPISYPCCRCVRFARTANRRPVFAAGHRVFSRRCS